MGTTAPQVSPPVLLLTNAHKQLAVVAFASSNSKWVTSDPPRPWPWPCPCPYVSLFEHEKKIHGRSTNWLRTHTPVCSANLVLHFQRKTLEMFFNSLWYQELRLTQKKIPRRTFRIMLALPDCVPG